MKSLKKITFIVVAAMVLVGCIFAAGCTNPDTSKTPKLIITVDKVGKTTYNPGDEFIITLPANPTSGYKWEVTNATPGLLYSQTDIPEKYAGDSKFVGKNNMTQTFVFDAKEEGTYSFSISYKRSGDDAGIYVYSDKLIVKNSSSKTKGYFQYDGDYLPTVGDFVQVKTLGNQASTGYKWNIETDPGLKLVKEEYIQEPTNGAVGVPGMHVWTFTADQPGMYEVVATESRSNDDIASSFFLPITFQHKISS